MSRRAAPDSPWQNGMPPFGLCQQQFNPMMNCGPMWAQPSLPFMGGSMAPDMMRFGGNVSSRSNFRRNYDQPDRYSRPRQPYGDRSGNRPSSYAGRGADRKRPAPGHRSRSPAAKKAKRLDGGRKPEQGKPKGAEEAGEEEEQDGAGPSAELYDPAEPTSEDAGDGVEQAEGNEDDESGAAQQDETADGGDEEGDAENDESAPQDESGDTAEGKPGPSKPAGKPGAKSGGGAAKASEAKSSGGRPGDKKDSAARSDKEQGAKRGGPRGKGWCTVCELHFEGNFLDHRRTEEHKTKRDEKYPKCHPCSMGFNNRVQYEQHCAGDFHRKNVEVLDNEVDETAGPLGEEYLEEVPAFFCTLCKILLKADLKKQHCCTQGHYRRHRDVKRKEEAALKAKLAKEKQADDEDEDVSQMAFTVTDEILSDDEAKAASEATAGESSKQVKVEEPAEVPPEDLPPQQQQDGEPETPMEEVAGAETKAEEEQPEPEVEVKAEQVKAEPEEGMENKELHEMKAEEEAAATAMDDSDEVAIPDTNGCKSMEEEGDEQQQQAPPATPAPKTAARAPSATAKTAPAPKALKAPAKPNLAPAKVPHKSVLAAKAAATPKPLAKPMSVTPKPAVAAPKPATRVPAAKAGTAASTAAVTSAPAATAAAAPGKKPAAGAAASEPSAAAGVGGMAGGRGRGTQKVVRGVGTRKR